MALIISYPVSYTPQTEASFTRTAIVPPRVACLRYPALNFVSQLGDRYNCQRCTTRPYFRPFEVGDIIPIQVNLPDLLNGNSAVFGPNASTANPNIGWRQTDLVNNFWYVKAEIYDATTDFPVPGFGLVNAFCSDWWVGYSNLVGSVQTLFIDTSLLPINLTSWYVRIAVRNVATAGVFTEATSIVSEPYCLANSCKNNVLIRSEYLTTDCENRDYRTPEPALFGQAQVLKYVHTPFNASNPLGYAATAFYISERYGGSVAAESFDGEKERDDLDNVRRFTRIETYRLIINEMLPPYAAKMLAIALQGSSFTVDNEHYNEATGVSKNVLEGLAFLPNIELTKRCQVNNNSCT